MVVFYVIDVAWSVHGATSDAQDTSDGDDGDDDMEEDSKAVGRVSLANLEIVKEAFVEVQARAKQVATQTGLSPSQVLDLWNGNDK